MKPALSVGANSRELGGKVQCYIVIPMAWRVAPRALGGFWVRTASGMLPAGWGGAGRECRGPSRKSRVRGPSLRSTVIAADRLWPAGAA